MDNVESGSTPGTDASFDLLTRISVTHESEERYPDGTILIPADSPDASTAIVRAIAEKKPLALVFPDGSDVTARPPEMGGLALVVVLVALWLVDRATRKRDRPTFVPREWVTEFHPSPRNVELVA